jgi:hypothetical protein
MISIEYTAGFIDGEGCFTTHHTQKGSPSLTIVNTDSDILDDIAELVFCITSIEPNIKSKWKSSKYPQRKECYCLRLGAPILRVFLPVILPYLRVKRNQAETMQELIDLIPSVHGPHNDGRGSATWRRRQELVDKISAEKH